MRRLSTRESMFGLVLLAAGLIAGAAVAPFGEAQAEIRATPPPQAFQSGGQLSVPVLKEIATTLRQIDSRLARLEAVAQKMQTTKGTSRSSD
jgi:hypothetical protein